MEQPKQLFRFQGESLLFRAALAATHSNASSTFVVLDICMTCEVEDLPLRVAIMNVHRLAAVVHRKGCNLSPFDVYLCSEYIYTGGNDGKRKTAIV